MIIRCKTGEIVYSLKEYYNTNHWNLLINDYIKSDLSKVCFKCKSKQNVPFRFFHRTKKRIGNEKLTDLLPVCNNCLKMKPDKSKKKNERRQLSSLGFNPNKVSHGQQEWMMSIKPSLRGHLLSKYYAENASKYNPSKQWINNQTKKACRWIKKKEKEK